MPLNIFTIDMLYMYIHEILFDADDIFFRGLDEKKKEAFRKWFGEIGELRSLFPQASILALSATCTHKISRRVYKILDLSVNTIETRISPNKPNIKIVVHKIPVVSFRK